MTNWVRNAVLGFLFCIATQNICSSPQDIFWKAFTLAEQQCDSVYITQQQDSHCGSGVLRESSIVMRPFAILVFTPDRQKRRGWIDRKGQGRTRGPPLTGMILYFRFSTTEAATLKAVPWRMPLGNWTESETSSQVSISRERTAPYFPWVYLSK